MSSLSRALLLACVCALSAGVALGQTASYSFCYIINGLASSTLDDPYSIAVYVTGTYNSTLQTSTATKYTPAGQYYTLLTGTGFRTINTRNPNANPVTQNIAQLDVAGFDYSDNRFYVSNQSFPQFVDADGLTFNLTEAHLFPGKTVATNYNLYRSGVYGAVLEDKTSGINLSPSAFSLAASGFPEWTGPSVSGPDDCVPNDVSVTVVQPSQNQQVQLTYNLTRTASPKWSVYVSVTFQTDGNVYGPDEFGDSWLVLSQTQNAVGTRTYCISATCSTVAITGAAPLNTLSFSDNQVYAYSPNLDYNGPAYNLASPQPKPGYTNTNFTTVVNPYVTKAGQFFEGFGVGGTGPNGSPNSALTTFSVHLI